MKRWCIWVCLLIIPNLALSTIRFLYENLYVEAIGDYSMFFLLIYWGFIGVFAGIRSYKRIITISSWFTICILLLSVFDVVYGNGFLVDPFMGVCGPMTPILLISQPLVISLAFASVKTKHKMIKKKF